MKLGEAMERRPAGGFKIVHADPAWSYENYSKKGTDKSAVQHYDCMTIDDIQNLPVEALAAPDAVLFLWVTDPLLQEGLATIEAWGFEYKTVAFTWIKHHEKTGAEFFGLGYFTRANPEMCLFATRGKPGRPKSKAVRQLLRAPIREHSRKPDEAIERIEAMYDGPAIELFARTQRPGWQCWGNETDKFEVAA